MATLETKIWMALRNRVRTLDTELPIAWPGSTYSPDGKAHISVQNITIAPSRILVQHGPHNRTGTLQIMLVQALGVDYSVGRQIAGDIASHFPTDLVLRYRDVCVRVTSAPDVSDGFREGAYWQTPIRIPWQTYN